MGIISESAGTSKNSPAFSIYQEEPFVNLNFSIGGAEDRNLLNKSRCMPLEYEVLRQILIEPFNIPIETCGCWVWGELLIAKFDFS